MEPDSSGTGEMASMSDQPMDIEISDSTHILGSGRERQVLKCGCETFPSTSLILGRGILTQALGTGCAPGTDCPPETGSGIMGAGANAGGIATTG